MTETTNTDALSITEALKTLRDELLHKVGPAAVSPRHLRPAEIRRFVAVFQPRALEGNLVNDDIHVSNLQDAIGDDLEKPRFLDPITVWWSGINWYVVDGFHRLLAYKRAGHARTPVPVQVFEGSLEEAVEHAAAANSKDKLPMSKVDKINMAWRLVLHFNRSKSQIAAACAVADGTVAAMRRAKRFFYDGGKSLDDVPTSWDDARREWQGHQRRSDFDHAAARRKKVERFSRSFSKHFGSLIGKDMDVLAAALVHAEERLPGWLMESPAWEESVRAAVENWQDPEY